jgi:ATP-binding cassette subfamily B protein
LDALERLNQHCTTFLITHDVTEAARADFIVYLERGQILERGTQAELLRANGRYAALHRLHAASRSGDVSVLIRS